MGFSLFKKNKITSTPMSQEEIEAFTITENDRNAIRLVMEQTGWSPYEAFCRMSEIQIETGKHFSAIAKGRLCKGYRNDRATDLVNGVAPVKYNSQICRERFDKAFYYKKQLKAIAEIKKGNITAKVISDFFFADLPKEIMDIEGDIRNRIKFNIDSLSKGDIFICVAKNYIVPDKLREVNPACVISYKTYANGQDLSGITFIPCKYVGGKVLDFARLWLDRFDVKTVGITGSIGKTSTTDMIGNVVDSSRNMHKAIGNRNTTWQIATFILKLKETTEVFVQEGSGSFPSQMEKTSRIVRPDIFVLTKIGTGHIGRYEGHQERLLYEKVAMDRNANDGACGVINWDDELLKKIKYLHEVVGFAIEDKSADFVAENIIEQDGAIDFDVVEKDGTSTHIRLEVIGRHNVYNSLAAFAVGVKLGIDRKVIAEAIGKFETDGARQNLVTYGGQKLYMDFCSATEESMRTATEAITNITVPEGCKKYLVLGDLQSLGDEKDTEIIHRRVGKMAAELGTADEIIFYGHEMANAMDEAEKLGARCKGVKERKELEQLLREETKYGDLIAIKSSHIMACQWLIDDIYGTNLYVGDKFAKNSPVVDEGNKTYKCIDDYGASVLRGDKNISRDSIPSEINGLAVRGIYDSAYRNAALEAIEMPSSITSIGANTFNGCRKLAEVSFPESLLYIGYEAFSGCRALEILDLSKGCVTIDENAFVKCRNLKEVWLPDNLKTVNKGAFGKNQKLMIHCNSGTYAEKWAKENGYEVINS